SHFHHPQDRRPRSGLKTTLTARVRLSRNQGETRMPSKNVETLRAAHESWNKRDFAGVVQNAAENLEYADQSRNVTLNNRNKFREWTEGWAKAFSDGRITKPKYIDAGDVVVAQFTVVGTNDGPFD